MKNIKDLDNDLDKIIDEYRDNLVDTLKGYAPVKTGALRDSIKNNKKDGIEMLEYGIFTNKGTYKIKPTYWIDNSIFITQIKK